MTDASSYKWIVIYDNASGGELIELMPADIPVFGCNPTRVEDGHIASYKFAELVDLPTLEEELEQSDWCYTSLISG